MTLRAMGQAAVRTGLSPQEYLELERSSEEKHEYADGEIFAMSGGSLAHSTIAASIIRELGSALLGRGCRVLTSDMRVVVPSKRRFMYPDCSVVCASPMLDDTYRDTLLNPLLLVEVLSESSEAYDRGDKFAQYRTIPSFEEYVVASQTEPRIEVFTRQADGSWVLRIYGSGERAVLSSIGCSLDVDRVYMDVFGRIEQAEASVVTS
jgi:Uma2 family endonuclease